MHGVNEAHKRRGHGAKHLVENFTKDPQSILEVIDKFSGDFQMRSETDDAVWYNISLLTRYCDCVALRRLCKHIIAMKNNINHQLEGLNDLLPLLEMYEDIILLIHFI